MPERVELKDYVEASKSLVKKALVSGDSEMLKEVKAIMDMVTYLDEELKKREKV